jgi:glutathione S-transferase
MLSLLGLEAEIVDLDLRQGDHRSAEFLALNPLGQVPVLEVDDLVIPDSNAILVYLALQFDPSRTWLPSDPTLAARVQRWLSLAAGELARGPGTARRLKLLGMPGDLASAQAVAEKLLSHMEAELTVRSFLVSETPTIADVALYTYTFLAPEGEISLEGYPKIRAWLARVEALPGFVPMKTR